MRINGKKGFTLVEILTVISILTIIAIIALPSFKNFTRKYRARSFCYDVIGLMNRGRIRAIESRQNISLSFDFDNEVVSISPALPSGGSVVDAPTGVDIYALTDDLTTTDPSASSGTTIKTISPSGSYLTGTNPQNYTVFIKSGNDIKYKIVVYGVTGNVSVEGTWE